MLVVVRNYCPKLGKKKTTEEKVKVARGKGFDDDITGIDDCLVLRDPRVFTRAV